jgi:Nucleoporin protein Ndc1-Nup
MKLSVPTVEVSLYSKSSMKLSYLLLAGLSRVVCASYTEDVYGVVQPSLPVIVTTLLDMLEVHFSFL